MSLTFITKSSALSNTSSFNTTQFRKGFLTKKRDISAKLINGTEPKLCLQLVKVHIAEFYYKYRKQPQEKETSRSNSITALIHTEPNWQTDSSVRGEGGTQI